MTEVAIVIPCCNLGGFLCEAVASAAEQTRPPAELVIIDDGSDDIATRNTLRTLELDGYRVIRTEPRGLAAAWNLGISVTRAPYVVALAPDDILERRYVEATAALLDRDPRVSFVATGVAAFGAATWVWIPPVADLEHAFGVGGPPQSSLFRREVWEAIHRYDETVAMYEDFDFWVRAMIKGYRGEVLPEPLLRCRVRLNSIHHRAVIEGLHAVSMEDIYRKHRLVIQDLDVAVLDQRERSILAQRNYRRSLREQQGQTESALAAVDAEIDQLQAELRYHSETPLQWGDFRRVRPLSENWGVDRGGPLDRYYIDRFLSNHRRFVAGRVLEVKDDGYARRIGGSAVELCDVLDINPANERATIVADLSRRNRNSVRHLRLFYSHSDTAFDLRVTGRARTRLSNPEIRGLTAVHRAFSEPPVVRGRRQGQ